MLFVIIAYDCADTVQKRQHLRPQHLARLKALGSRLVLAGPTPIVHGDAQMSGSLIVADFDSQAHAHAWAQDDPYLLGRVYSHFELRPFVQVLPQGNP